jgi:fibronectin-binding autotransporter adhesin
MYFIVTVLLVVLLLSVPIRVGAATRTWDGGGADNLWSTCQNWSSDACPVAGDTATFDGTSTKTSFLDSAAAGTIAVLNMNAGYTGTISLGRSFSLTSTFTQASGTIELLGQPLTLQSTVTVSSGTFTAGTGTVALTGGAATIDVANTLTLNNLTINATGGTTKTIASNDTLVVTGTLTLTDGLVSQSTIPAVGTIRAQGSIVQASTFDGGTATIAIDGIENQLFTASSTVTTGLLPKITIQKSSGTLTLSGTVRATSNWTYRSGIIDAATNNATVIFAATLTLSGSHTLRNVRFDGNTSSMTITMPATTTLTVEGTLTMDQTGNAGTITLNTGTFAVQGDISMPDALTHGGTATLLINGAGAQLWTSGAASSAGGMIHLIMSKPSGSTLTLSGLIRTSRNWTYVSGDVDATTHGATVEFFGTNSPVISGSHTLHNIIFNLVSGNLDRWCFVGTSTTLTAAGTLTLTDGQMNGGVVEALDAVSIATTFDGGTGSLLISGGATRTINLPYSGGIPGITVTAPNVTINGPGSGGVVIAGEAGYQQIAGVLSGGSGAMHVLGNFSLEGGIFTAPKTLSVGGAFTYQSGTFSHNGGTVLLSAATDQSLLPPPVLYNLTMNEGLASYWKFDETGGSFAEDSSGMQQTGTFIGSAGTGNGAPPVSFNNDRSLSLDGSASYVTMGTSTFLDYALSGPSSSSVWIKTNITGSLRIVGKSDFGANTTNLFGLAAQRKPRGLAPAMDSAAPRGR